MMDPPALLQEDACTQPLSEHAATSSAEAKTSNTLATSLEKLPAEIRSIIWKLVLPEPGIVHLRFREKDKLQEKPRICLTPSRPVTLEINQESRLESIAYLTQRTTLSLQESDTPLRYFFSTRDTALVDTQSLGKIAFHFLYWYIQLFLGQEGLSQIRHFAIEDIVWNQLHSPKAKKTEWKDWVLKLDKFIIFVKEAGDERRPAHELEFFEPTTEMHSSGLVSTLLNQAVADFAALLPNSTRSSDERRIPRIEILGARTKNRRDRLGFMVDQQNGGFSEIQAGLQALDLSSD